MRFVYNILLTFFAIPGLLFFLLKMLITGKYRNSFIQKLGGKQKPLLEALPKGRRIWIHAVSVGEVTAAAPIVAALKKRRPDVKIVFSTSTETGQGMAQKLVSGADVFIYFPLDFFFAVNRMLKLVKPDVFVLVETELWPNFLSACRSRGIRIVMANGRISPRSFGKYLRTRFFWKKALENIDAAGMISEIDASRIKQMGMDSARIQILGNAKYDALAAMASPELSADIVQRFGIRPQERFFVAGSTHAGEEKVVIEVYQKLLQTHPEFNLILVPRHIERAPDVMSLLQRNGFEDSITVSQMRAGRARQQERIIVVDVIGELFKVYSLATVVYCGGSLVPKGGQNILEASAWGKVIFYGPSMEDFTQEAALLESVGAGIRVTGAEDLLKGILHVLADPDELQARGNRGQAIVRANMGAAERYAELIARHLD